MARLTRAEQQQRTRRAVLEAAVAEFAEYGYAGAKVDRIADRAEMTRGAVYANFDSKRVLLLSAMAHLAEQTRPNPTEVHGGTVADVLGSMVEGLTAAPDVGGPAAAVGLEFLVEMQADPTLASAVGGLIRLEATLVADALERVHQAGGGSGEDSLAHTAQGLMTLWYGWQASVAFRGSLDPAAVVDAARALATIPPRPRTIPHPGPTAVTAVEPRPWEAPPCTDLIREEPVTAGTLHAVLVVPHDRLDTVPHAMAALRLRDPAGRLLVALTTDLLPELDPLAQALLRATGRLLRQTVPASCLPNAAVVSDPDGAIRRSLGMTTPGPATETAVRLADGRITARAEGVGAGLAVLAHTDVVDRASA